MKKHEDKSIEVDYIKPKKSNTKFDVKKINKEFIQRHKDELRDFNLIEPSKINTRLYCFCDKGDFDSVKKIFNSPKYQPFIDLGYLKNITLKHACMSGNLNLVKFLLHNDISKANILDENCYIIIDLIVWGHNHILDYLVFEYGLTKESLHDDVFQFYKNSHLEKIFDVKKLHDQLSENLTEKNDPNKLQKI